MRSDEAVACAGGPWHDTERSWCPSRGTPWSVSTSGSHRLFTHVHSWPRRPLAVCVQEVVRWKAPGQERWQADLQVSFRHSREKTQWALEVNASVIGRDEQDPAWDRTASHMGVSPIWEPLRK